MSDYQAGLEGVPATKSNISFLDGKRGILTYRGYRLVDLAENSTFEETAYLLLDGELPNRSQLERFDSQLREHRTVKYNVRDIMKALPVTGHPMEMLQTAVASLGMFYPNDVPVQIRSPGDESDQYVHGQSIRILARMATLVAMGFWTETCFPASVTWAQPHRRWRSGYGSCTESSFRFRVTSVKSGRGR